PGGACCCCVSSHLFCSTPPCPSPSTLLPYTTLFRSIQQRSVYRNKILGMKISSLVLALLAGATPLLAQEATPPLVPDTHSETIMDTLIKAGPVMVPLVLLSIFSVMLVIVYLMTIRRGAVVSSG